LDILRCKGTFLGQRTNVGILEHMKRGRRKEGRKGERKKRFTDGKEKNISVSI